MFTSVRTRLPALPRMTWSLLAIRVDVCSQDESKDTIMMNKNQAQGAIKDLEGKVQESAGKLIGSKDQQSKGLQKQVLGKAEKTLGDAQAAVKGTADAVKASLRRP